MAHSQMVDYLNFNGPDLVVVDDFGTRITAAREKLARSFPRPPTTAEKNGNGAATAVDDDVFSPCASDETASAGDINSRF